jgi:hypothetical protein
MMHPVERRYEEWDRDLTLVRVAARDLNVAEISLRHHVGVARRSGHSWSAIGLVLGISEQDARDRYGWPDSDAPQ